MQSRQESCYDQIYRRRGMRWDVRGFLNARSELHTSPLAAAKGRQTMYSTYGLQQSHLTPEHPSLGARSRALRSSQVYPPGIPREAQTQRGTTELQLRQVRQGGTDSV